MAYYIRQEKTRQFVLEYAGELLSTLRFPKWSSTNAELKTSSGIIKFAKEKFWKTNYEISKDGQTIGKVSVNWKGQLFLELFEPSEIVPSNLEMVDDWSDNGVTKYRVKFTGLLKQRYELYQGNDNRPLITLHAETNWFKVSFRVELQQEDLIPFSVEDILGMMTFCAYLIWMRQAAAAA
ncbi:MAG: hypothetical protein AAGJ18_06550 [Bacteroidota bacterium]